MMHYQYFQGLLLILNSKSKLRKQTLPKLNFALKMANIEIKGICCNKAHIKYHIYVYENLATNVLWLVKCFNIIS